MSKKKKHKKKKSYRNDWIRQAMIDLFVGVAIHLIGILLDKLF